MPNSLSNRLETIRIVCCQLALGWGLDSKNFCGFRLTVVGSVHRFGDCLFLQAGDGQSCQEIFLVYRLGSDVDQRVLELEFENDLEEISVFLAERLMHGKRSVVLLFKAASNSIQ